MQLADMIGRSCVIWGTGKEGLAAAHMLVHHIPPIPFTFVDEQDGPDSIKIYQTDIAVCRSDTEIRTALAAATIIIKSPGVSLYHPALIAPRARGALITSLLNLWLAENPAIKVLLVTGTKGKSTTSTLLAHTLNAMGHNTVVMGNIGTPLGTALPPDLDYLVLETSSYQAATLTETVTVSVMTSLYPEHLDWHTSLPIYYRDKANALCHSQHPLISAEAYQTLQETTDIQLPAPLIFNTLAGIHAVDADIYSGPTFLGRLDNPLLTRPHNLNNTCAVLAVLSVLGLDLTVGIAAMTHFKGLPHRQNELGTIDHILYVDDSISTTPESTIAALNAYAGRPIALILGGHDRGIPYDKLIAYIHTHTGIRSVLCLGDAGQRIHDNLLLTGDKRACMCPTMLAAVTLAQNSLHKENSAVVLLSPAASSYGMFKDYVDRAQCFALAAGFKA